MVTTRDIVVFGEQENGTPHRIATELATGARGLAQELGGTVIGLTLGQEARRAAEALGQFGLSRVYYNANPALTEYGVQAQAHALAAFVRVQQPAAVLLPATSDGRDVAARLSAILGQGILCNAARLYVEGGKLISEQAAFEGTLLIACTTRDDATQIITVRGKVFPAEKGDSAAPPEEFAYTPAAEHQHVRVLEVVHQEERQAVALEGANVIVAGGRGVGGPEGFEPLRELAQALGGALGASRAAVDAGWAPYALQIGQTGKTVKPKAYLAIGISGAIQHKVGMQNADAIIAINKDADAPIFAFADLGIVGDLNQIVPPLTDAIRKRRSEQ